MKEDVLGHIAILWLVLAACFRKVKTSGESLILLTTPRTTLTALTRYLWISGYRISGYQDIWISGYQVFISYCMSSWRPGFRQPGLAASCLYLASYTASAVWKHRDRAEGLYRFLYEVLMAIEKNWVSKSKTNFPPPDVGKLWLSLWELRNICPET